MFERIASIAATLVALGLVGCGSPETLSTEYDDYDAVSANGAMSRGWIPMWLPRTASQIREIHNVDTNQSMLAFRFQGTEALEHDGCSQVEGRALRAPPFDVSWWPADVPPNGLATHRHSFFACEQETAFLAVSSDLGEGFYWRP